MFRAIQKLSFNDVKSLFILEELGVEEINLKDGPWMKGVFQ